MDIIYMKTKDFFSVWIGIFKGYLLLVVVILLLSYLFKSRIITVETVTIAFKLIIMILLLTYTILFNPETSSLELTLPENINYTQFLTIPLWAFEIVDGGIQLYKSITKP